MYFKKIYLDIDCDLFKIIFNMKILFTNFYFYF